MEPPKAPQKCMLAFQEKAPGGLLRYWEEPMPIEPQTYWDSQAKTEGAREGEGGKNWWFAGGASVAKLLRQPEKALWWIRLL